MEILLNKNKGEGNVNVDNSVNVELSTSQSLLPPNDVIDTINQYEIYLNERNNTKNYKIFFSIAPFMTNVLFNTFTEIVGNEGGANSFMLGDKGYTKRGDWSTNAVRKLSKGLTRIEAIKDTEYSHPLIGNLTYQCGLDIFDNHYLRSKGFFRMKKVYNGSSLYNKTNFNTIEDYLSYGDGKIVKNMREIPGSSNKTETIEKEAHVFNHENLNTMFTAFVENLKEENGWFGFINRTYANEVNHSVANEDVIINKCINNKASCEFIDLYPTRKEFSFLPILNANANRYEYNWDWCITYPYKKIETGFDFFDNKRGLLICSFITDSFLENNKNSQLKSLSKSSVTRENKYVHFRTISKHGLKENDLIRISYGSTDFSLRVVGVGDINGHMKDYYFYVSYDDLANEFGEKVITVGEEKIEYIKLNFLMYVGRIVNGVPCEYYVRKFKEIRGLNSTINKAGFAKTIYNDPIVQIIYSDDINVNGIKNHLGFELNEVFLTIIKKNVGYDMWYLSGVTNPSFVEASHCFGRVSAGFNFERLEGEEIQNEGAYKSNNVRYYTEYPTPNINPSSVEYEGLDRVFLGDFVEFSPMDLNERVLEDAQHRFNTAQRELSLSGNTKFPCNFSDLSFHEIVYDDNDFNPVGATSFSAATKSNIPDFKVSTTTILSGNANISPEGYFYRPHYAIKLKEYASKVQAMGDILLQRTSSITKNGTGYFEYSFTTEYDYQLRENDVLVLYKNGKYEEGVVSSKTLGQNVVFTINKTDNELNYEKVFLKNQLIPEETYYLPNGSGKRLWREVIKESELPQTSDIYNRTFANGSIYINTNINFFLRRQDPDGIYGLRDCSYSNSDSLKTKSDFVMAGLKQSLPDVEYKTNSNYTVCEV